MRTRRLVLYAAVTALFLVAGCGQTHIEQKRNEARERWTKSRAEMATKLAEGCFKRGEFSRAQQHVDELLKTGAPYAPLYALAARLAAERGDLDDAQDYAESAMLIDPASAEACYVLGTIEQTLGHSEKALERFAEAARLNPEKARYALAEAEMLVAVGQPQVAAEHLHAAVGRMPGAAELHAALGDVLSLLGRHEEATGSLRIALRLNPDGRGIRERLAIALFHSRSYVEAEGLLAELAQSEPDFACGWLIQMRADCLLALGRGAEAQKACEKQAAAYPDAPGPLVALAKCEITADRLATAREFLEKALACEPGNGEANALMGYVLVASGRSGEAISHLELALRDPNCVSRETVEYLLARAQGLSPAPLPEPGPQPPEARGMPSQAERQGAVYAVARPVNSS